MLPADQRLDAENRAGQELDDRLIVEDELGGDVGATEVRDQLEPADEVLVHSRRVDDVLRLPAGLRAVHRDVGAPQQLLGVATDCDADARRDEHLASVDVERRLQRGGDPLGRVECGRGGVCPLDEDRELVAAHPRDRVRRRERCAQTHAHRPEQGVPGDVAEAVVDRLEVVEVEEENSGVARTHDERVLDAIREERPVGEPGQRVVEGLVAKLLLGLRARRDVEEVSLEHRLPAVRVVDDVRLVVHPHDASVPGVEAVVGAERLAGRRASSRARPALALDRRDAGATRTATGHRPTPRPSSRASARSEGSCRRSSWWRRPDRCRRRAVAARRASGSGSRPAEWHRRLACAP